MLSAITEEAGPLSCVDRSDMHNVMTAETEDALKQRNEEALPEVNLQKHTIFGVSAFEMDAIICQWDLEIKGVPGVIV